MNFICPNPGCGRQLQITRVFAGDTVTCPFCGQMMQIPNLASVQEPPHGLSGFGQQPTHVREGVFAKRRHMVIVLSSIAVSAIIYAALALHFFAGYGVRVVVKPFDYQIYSSNTLVESKRYAAWSIPLRSVVWREDPTNGMPCFICPEQVYGKRPPKGTRANSLPGPGMLVVYPLNKEDFDKVKRHVVK